MLLINCHLPTNAEQVYYMNWIRMLIPLFFIPHTNCCKRSVHTLCRLLAGIMWCHSQFSSSQFEKHIVTSCFVGKRSCQSKEGTSRGSVITSYYLYFWRCMFWRLVNYVLNIYIHFQKYLEKVCMDRVRQRQYCKLIVDKCPNFMLTYVLTLCWQIS